MTKEQVSQIIKMQKEFAELYESRGLIALSSGYIQVGTEAFKSIFAETWDNVVLNGHELNGQYEGIKILTVL